MYNQNIFQALTDRSRIDGSQSSVGSMVRPGLQGGLQAMPLPNPMAFQGLSNLQQSAQQLQQNPAPPSSNFTFNFSGGMGGANTAQAPPIQNAGGPQGMMGGNMLTPVSQQQPPQQQRPPAQQQQQQQQQPAQYYAPPPPNLGQIMSGFTGLGQLGGFTVQRPQPPGGGIR